MDTLRAAYQRAPLHTGLPIAVSPRLPQVQQSGVPLLRMRFDPAAGDVDPRFYQYVRGLWNITSPTAGGDGAAR